MYNIQLQYLTQCVLEVHCFIRDSLGLLCRTADDETLLLLGIRHQLHEVVERLCGMGADLSVSDCKGNSPLWVALRSRQYTCAEKLVSGQ